MQHSNAGRREEKLCYRKKSGNIKNLQCCTTVCVWLKRGARLCCSVGIDSLLIVMLCRPYIRFSFVFCFSKVSCFFYSCDGDGQHFQQQRQQLQVPESCRTGEPCKQQHSSGDCGGRARPRGCSSRQQLCGSCHRGPAAAAAADC